MRQRFEKLVAMAPQVVPGDGEAAKSIFDLDHATLRMQLSPISGAKVQQLILVIGLDGVFTLTCYL